VDGGKDVYSIYFHQSKRKVAASEEERRVKSQIAYKKVHSLSLLKAPSQLTFSHFLPSSKLFTLCCLSLLVSHRIVYSKKFKLSQHTPGGEEKLRIRTENTESHEQRESIFFSRFDSIHTLK
jgi:hypothetical protein